MNANNDNTNASIEISDQSGESFTAVWNWFLDREDLSNNEKMIWIALKSYAGYQEIRPSIMSISKRASVSVRTTQRTLSSLAEKQIIHVDPRADVKGCPLPNRYTLLPLKQQVLTKKDKAGGWCQADTTPGVNLTPDIDRFYITKLNTTTTPRKNESATGQAGGDAGPEHGRRDSIKQNLEATILAAADIGSIMRAAKKFNRTGDDIALIIDVLDQQYRKSHRSIDDPTGLVVAALRDGITPPENYVSKSQREKLSLERQISAKQKADNEQLVREAEDAVYKTAEAEFDSLSDDRREEIFSQARAKLPLTLRESKRALKTFAIQMLIAKARAPNQTENSPR
jgi:hypothetical protein